MPAKPDPLGTFIVGRLLAERAGLGSFQATQWGAVLMATGLSPASILLVSELARLDAMRLSEPANNQTELRNMVQQALQKAQEAAETATRAAESTEQIIAQLNEMNQRIAELAASTGDPVCSREFCEEVLAILHQLREHANWGGGCVGLRRKRWFRCRPLRWLDRRR